jgi:hypothetical protein
MTFGDTTTHNEFETRTQTHTQTKKRWTYKKIQMGVLDELTRSKIHTSATLPIFFPPSIPALSRPSMILPVPGCTAWLLAVVLEPIPPHSMAARGLRERKRKVNVHSAMRERSSMPALPGVDADVSIRLTAGWTGEDRTQGVRVRNRTKARGRDGTGTRIVIRELELRTIIYYRKFYLP